MTERQQAKPFVERILRISPVYNDVFGAGLPGMGGTATATSGAANSGTDVVMQLHRSAIAFARAYDALQPDQATVRAAADEVDVLLRTVQVLGVLSEKDAGQLLDSLDELLK